jgi:hypothetical protein
VLIKNIIYSTETKRQIRVLLKKEYESFFDEEVRKWFESGKVFSITGVLSGNISGDDSHFKRIYQTKRKSLIYFFNKYQRSITGARRWNKEIHRRLDVILIPEYNGGILHFHGIMKIPSYTYNKKKSNILKDEELVDLKCIQEFYDLYKEIFKRKCRIEPCIDDGWIRYINKNYRKGLTVFDESNFLILPE